MVIDSWIVNNNIVKNQDHSTFNDSSYILKSFNNNTDVKVKFVPKSYVTLKIKATDIDGMPIPNAKFKVGDKELTSDNYGVFEYQCEKNSEVTINSSLPDGTNVERWELAAANKSENYESSTENFYKTAVTVKGVKNMTATAICDVANNYTLSYSSGTNGTISATYNDIDTPISSGSNVSQGSSIKLVAKPHSGYEFIGFKINGKTYNTTSDYVLSSIQEDTTVEPIFRQMFNVNLASGNGFELVPCDTSTSPVSNGGSYTFMFKLLVDYSQSKPVVSVNGNPVTLTDNKYTISNITKDQTVTVTGIKKNSFNVNLPTGEGYTVATQSGSATSVNIHDDYSFKVNLADGYYKTDDFSVKVNDEKVTDKNGVYTISKIIENKTIKVEGVAKKKFNVTLSSGTNYSLVAKQNSQSPVLYGGNFTFVFTPNDETYNYTVKVNGTPVSIKNNEFTILDIKEAKNVTVEYTKKDSFAVNLPTNQDGYSLTADIGSVSPVIEGNSYTLSFKLDDAYNQSTPIIKVNGKAITLTKGKYTIDDIKEIKNITVEGVVKNKYNINLTSNADYSLSPKTSTDTSVSYGGNFTFVLNPLAQKESIKPIVKVNGQTISLNNNEYTIENVTKDANVTVETIQKDNYYVNLATAEGYTLAPLSGNKNEVIDGGSFGFSLNVDTAYNNSTPVVKVNGQPVNLVDGKYTINNISENKNVTVEGVKKNTYTVTQPSSQIGYSITSQDNNTVEYDGSYTFKLALKDGYTDSTPVVKVNGKPIDLANGEYTISGIKEDKAITVDGIKSFTYKVTLPTSQVGYSISSNNSSTVAYDGSYTFKLTLNDGYTGSTPVVKVNGKTVTLTGGEFTISGVKEDKTITVEGVKINNFKVNLPTSQVGYSISSNNSSTVAYDGSYTFKLTLNDGYTGSTPVVKVNGKTVTLTGGEFTISGVKEDTAITVEGVKINNFKVNLPTSQVGYSISSNNSSTVAYDGSYTFKLTLNDGYTGSTPVVKVNGKTVTLTGGEFTISGVKEDTAITVEGVKINNFKVNLPTSQTGYSISSNNGSTVAYNGSYTFKLTLNNGYTASTPVIKVNGKTLISTNGEFTISGIREDTVITVEGVKANPTDNNPIKHDNNKNSNDNQATSKPTEKPTYYFIFGANSSYDLNNNTTTSGGNDTAPDNSTTRESKVMLTFRINATYDKFTNLVKVDGKVVSPENYTSESGSTIIRFKPEFLKTLSVGKHTLDVAFTDGEAATEFTIKEQNTPLNSRIETPKTSESNNLPIILMLLISAFGIFIIINKSKRTVQ